MKHRFLALAQALMVCLSLFSVIAQAADGTISLDKGVYSPNETIIVQVSGITEKMVDDEAYVSIYEKGAPHTEYMDWLRPEAGDGQLEFDAPSQPGLYEMRLYNEDYKYTDDTLVMSVPFTVVLEKQGKISLLGSETKITGNYTISGDKITFTYKSSEATVDSGKTWTAGEIPSPDSHYYEIDTSDSVTYLLMGLKDATLPLNTESNAIRLTLMD